MFGVSVVFRVKGREVSYTIFGQLSQLSQLNQHGVVENKRLHELLSWGSRTQLIFLKHPQKIKNAKLIASDFMKCYIYQ